MAAVSITEPLCRPSVYDTKFRVELHMKKPLAPIHLSREQVRLEMLCLCSQLDVLIRAQFQEQLRQDGSPVEPDLFHREAAEIVEKMNLCLEHLSEPIPHLEDYLDAVGLSAMFPRVEVFIIHGSPVDMLEKPLMDDYFPHIGKLNQLLVLSQQLEDDVKHLGSHKYVAHQLSVIYGYVGSGQDKHAIFLDHNLHVLSSFKSVLPLLVMKRDIEANFKNLKMALVTEEGSKQEPQLSAHYINWILDVIQHITSTVSSLPEELTQELSPALSFVSSLT